MHTGDIGRFDADGYLHLVDRAKDVIKSGGEWISSITLENLIGQHPAVREVAVIGVADARWGERPLALVVAHAGVPVDAEALRRHLTAFVDKGEISRYAVPERFVLVDELDKKRLRERHAQAVA
jgi:fatty-acyl-CoA synthase